LLTQRAILNALTGVADQGTRILVGFFITPILVTHLGGLVFGIWQVIQKASIQLSALDGRSSEVLKWVISNLQDKDNDDDKKEALAASILCFLIFLPLLLVINGVWIYYLPQYVEVTTLSDAEIRITAILLLVNLLLMSIAAIIEAVIRGMNMAYKLVGVLAIILLCSGLATAYAAYAGLGIIGVAAAQILTGVFSIAAYFWVLKRHVKWVGLKKPTKQVIKQSLNRSMWFSSWGFINTWILAGDVIVLGALVESNFITQYVLTLYASQMISIVILTAISAALPGLGGIIGNNEFERAQGLRNESLLYSWCLAVAICATVIIVNPSFVSLWVGDDQFAGYEVSFLLALCVFQLLFIRHDAFMMNLALDIKQKVILGFISSIFTLLLMLFLVPEYGLIGMCISLIIGRSVLSFSYPKIISKFFQSKTKRVFLTRHYISTISIFLLAYYLSDKILISSWLVLLGASVLVMILIIAVMYFMVLTGQQKNTIAVRFKSVVLRKRA
jgi:O-antigen/teichoic acid export membrane protein